MTNYEMKEELGASEALITVISRILYKKSIDYNMKRITIIPIDGSPFFRKEVATYDLYEVLKLLQERLEHLTATCSMKERKAVAHTARMVTELEKIIEDCLVFNVDTGV